MTTVGDIIYSSDGSGTPARLAAPAATAGMVLTSSGGAAPTYTSKVPGRNMILNGAMVFDQNKEGGAYSSTSVEVYSLDQWRYAGDGAGGVFTVQRTASSAPGFPFSLNMVVTTQQASLGSTANFHLEYPIEGNSIGRLKWGTANAETVALSFWAWASTTGDYSVALMEGTNSRSYVTSFTISSASTWEKKTIIIPGDTSGTYQTGAGTFGLKVLWSLGVGSTYSTSTTEAWQGAAYWNKTGTNQLIQQANGQGLYVTGVQLEVGNAATPFEHLEPTAELNLLRRYYYKTFASGTAVAQNAGANGSLCYVAQVSSTSSGYGLPVRYPVQMTSAPTITYYNTSAANGKWRAINGATADSGTPTAFFSTADGHLVINPQTASDVLGSIICVHLTANARLGGG